MKNQKYIENDEAREKLTKAAYIAYFIGFGLIGIPLSMYVLLTNADTNPYQPLISQVWFGAGLLALFINLKGSRPLNKPVDLFALVLFGVCGFITVLILEIYKRILWKKYKLI